MTATWTVAPRARCPSRHPGATSGRPPFRVASVSQRRPAPAQYTSPHSARTVLTRRTQRRLTRTAPRRAEGRRSLRECGGTRCRRAAPMAEAGSRLADRRGATRRLARSNRPAPCEPARQCSADGHLAHLRRRAVGEFSGRNSRRCVAHPRWPFDLTARRARRLARLAARSTWRRAHLGARPRRRSARLAHAPVLVAVEHGGVSEIDAGEPLARELVRSRR